ncbi:MAG: class I SAM-dependent methyltransferase [Thaumarchaeota archaeon]|nr:class I SAM-dependent methyltransferase [Nitrososphaerota archaeon]
MDVLLWTFRRNEADVVNMYDALALLMQISTGGNMLNFGYWTDKTTAPSEAQTALCRMIGGLAELGSARDVLDVGSGFSEPADVWKGDFPQIRISCLNVNRGQLEASMRLAGIGRPDAGTGIGLINSTATRLPLADGSMDRVIALESAQHFRPFSEFVHESRRVLRPGGILAIAIPVVVEPARIHLFKLGILSFTWSSEHYMLDDLTRTLSKSGMKVASSELIGKKVYNPLADYYLQNREYLRKKILERYPSYVEGILYRSLLKMREVSNRRRIEYALIKCVA